MKGRLYFTNGAIQHIYQKTVGGFLIFYSVRDCLVFFTMIATAARRYHIRILGICLMVDHVHVLVEAGSKQEMDQFVCLYTSWFVNTYNKWYGLKGSLFKANYGAASKVDDKKQRSAIAYLYNNPVERLICKRAEQYPWNFLAYANSRFPFVSPARLDKARAPMRRAVDKVKCSRKDERPLNYAQLKRMTAPLTQLERKQLYDVIVSAYNCVDYQDLFYRFGNYTDLIMAINTTTGSEYAIPEEFVGRSDRIYSQMTEFLLESRRIQSTDDLLRMPETERRELLDPLGLRTGASRRQLEKYLRLRPGEPRGIERAGAAGG